MEKIAIANQAELLAVAVLPTPSEPIAHILSELALPPHQAVLVVTGSADSLDARLVPKLTQFFGRGVARAALEAGALVVDGGTQAGVMALMGEGLASRPGPYTLVGVAPASLVTYPGGPATGVALEPNHSHFVLVEGTHWGSETGRLFELVGALALPAAGPPAGLPAVVLLVGGGNVARSEMVQAARRGLPVVVLAGSGGLADELAAAWPMRDTPPEDADLAEILADGRLRIYPLGGSVQGLERLLVRELGADQVLLQAWETFADYDANASLQQKRFDYLQQAVILLGLLGTALAIGQQVYGPKEPNTGDLLATVELLKTNQIGWWLLHHALLVIPIALTVLVTATNRFKQGTKWLLLRAGAEAIKREIYRYRTQAQCYRQDAEPQLAQRVEEITRRTMRTEVNTSSLRPYDKLKGFPPDTGATGDDGLSPLSPARYIEVRLSNQLDYFRRKAVRLEKQLKMLSWLTFIVGGIGTYLAAVSQQVWIALSTALVAAMGSYLGYRQTESTLTKYNQAATDLANVRAWWRALPPDQQLLPANIDLLVEHTEQVLQSESDSWVQQMQNALADLHKNQRLSAEQRENTEALATAPATTTIIVATTNTPPATDETPAAAPAEVATDEAENEAVLTAEAALPTEDTTTDELPLEAALLEPAEAVADEAPRIR